MIRCSKCGTELAPEEPGAGRLPCPKCGSLARTHEQEMTGTVTVTGSVETSVERGVTEARMAGFTVILATALSVGLAVGFASGALLGIAAHLLNRT